MRQFIIFISIGLLSVACADKKSANKDPSTTSNEEGLVSKSVASKNIILKSPQFDFSLDFTEATASLRLVGDDGKALHKGMFGKTKSKQKIGTHFTCLEIDRRASECRFSIDWKNGEILPQTPSFDEDDLGKGTPYYQGSVLTLGSKKSYIALSGNLAFTLYSLLEVSEVDQEKSVLRKQGTNYSCSKTSSRDEGDVFNCLIKIDPRIGKVI